MCGNKPSYKVRHCQVANKRACNSCEGIRHFISFSRDENRKGQRYLFLRITPAEEWIRTKAEARINPYCGRFSLTDSSVKIF
jgi:hypothetical protein